jgi:FRG domain
MNDEGTTSPVEERQMVESLGQYVEAVDRIWSTWTDQSPEIMEIWFRGQSSSTHQVIPIAYRSPYSEVDEHRYRHEFFLRARAYLEEATTPPATEWDWYFLMQHYGVPTRLLDFSESSLSALYFALQTTDRTNSPCVWVLHPRAFNERLSKNSYQVPIYTDAAVSRYLPSLWDENAELPIAPLAFDPPYNSRRLVAQKGKFVVFGSSKTPLDQYGELREYFVRIEIPSDAISKLRRQLGGAGVSESVLFPGLAGLGREIRESYVEEFL